MNTDKIREILKSVFDSANYRDMNNVTDKIITAITPYLSHWITEAEAKPGAIERILIDLEKTGAEYKTRINPNDYKAGDYVLQRCAAARAELAQLQADRDRSVADNIKLRTEIVKSDKRDMAIKISNQETEIENLKGALRTLAIASYKNECPIMHPCDAEQCKEDGKGSMNCIDAKIAYALAHPTEDHPSPLANDDK